MMRTFDVWWRLRLGLLSAILKSYNNYISCWLHWDKGEKNYHTGASWRRSNHITIKLLHLTRDSWTWTACSTCLCLLHVSCLTDCVTTGEASWMESDQSSKRFAPLAQLNRWSRHRGRRCTKQPVALLLSRSLSTVNGSLRWHRSQPGVSATTPGFGDVLNPTAAPAPVEIKSVLVCASVSFHSIWNGFFHLMTSITSLAAVVNIGLWL